MTVEKIAKLAGVSPATVSRVFNHHPNIRADVRRLVLETARKYNYHPGVPEKRKNVVLITPSNSIFPVHSCVDMLLMALMRELPSRGFRIEILPLDNLERLKSIQFCGAAAIGCEPDEFKAWEDSFAVPLVIVDRAVSMRASGIYAVRSDEKQGMALAVDALADRGCRKIGCIIHGEPEYGNAALRRDAVEKALIRRNLPHSARLILFSGLGSDRYMELTGKLLKQDVDALFCPGGNAGTIEMYVLNLFGKKAPDDISLVTSEQTGFSQYAVPPQTTITQDYPLIAKSVADVIESTLNNQPAARETVIPYRLIERESVR